MTEFRTLYSPHNPDDYADDYSEVEDLCDPSEANDVSLPSILERFNTTGLLPQAREGKYLDVSDVPNLARAARTDNYARQIFASLPAATRDKFSGDYLQFTTWASTASPEELAAMGVVSSSEVKSDKASQNATNAKSEAKSDKTEEKQKPAGQ